MGYIYEFFWRFEENLNFIREKNNTHLQQGPNSSCVL